MDVQVSSTQWQRSESVKQYFIMFLSRSLYYYALITLPLRPRCLSHALIRFLLRPDLAMSSLRFFKHAHSSTTFVTSTKTFLRSYRFQLRSTILSSYCVHPIFDDVEFRINTVTCVMGA